MSLRKGIHIQMIMALLFFLAVFPQIADAMTPDEAIQKILKGNKRFVHAQMKHPDQTQAHLKEVSKVQDPFATILSCSDSRAPLEVITDQGLGDLFVIRNAGNVLDVAVLGSIEYAVEHLETPLVLVLGHKRCGGVTAAVNHVTEAHIKNLALAITPAVNKAKEKNPADLIDASVRENVRMVTAALRNSKPIIADKVKSKAVKVVGGYYDIDTGKIEIIDDMP
jgi:carbonic anhydrase